jgi:hypothetical protein
MSARTIIETSPGRFKDPDTNKRTSKQDGDVVVTAVEWERVVKSSSKSNSEPEVVLSTGKVANGPTLEITCKEKGCTEKRVIRRQDKFQVRYCLTHQREHRNELRRKRREALSKNKAKAKA